MQKTIFTVFKWFVGVLFILSGLIKANDTLGFGYKLQEYFEVFHLNFLNSYAVGLAIFLCVLEVALGTLLLLGFWRKWIMRSLLALILFFTFLTFVSAAFKVVTTCGCFGDAVPLTPWQSFGKDIVLLIMIAYIFRFQQWLVPVTGHRGWQAAFTTLAWFVPLLFASYTYRYLPVIDFLPYKIGANIPQNMVLPPGAQPDEYEITYQLKNKVTKETKEMSDKDYLKLEIWKDENWEVVGNPTSKLIKQGYQVPIKDLLITDATGTDYTKELIENPYYNLVIVAYDLKATNENALARLNALALNVAQQYNIRTVLLTANSAADAEVVNKRLNLFAEIFYVDAVPLKSMVRANPGILLLKNGVVINKWHYNSLPSFEELAEKYLSSQQ